MKNAVRTLVMFAVTALVLAPVVMAADGKTSDNARTTEVTDKVAPKRADYSVYSDVAKSAALAGEQINWQVISGGGNTSSSGTYILNGTVGQTAVGAVSSVSYGLNQGYWQSFTSGGCCTLRGDVDGSGALNVSDLTYLVAYLFQGGPSAPCADHADVDGSGAINVSDLTYLVAYLFQGGPVPGAC